MLSTLTIFDVISDRAAVVMVVVSSRSYYFPFLLILIDAVHAAMAQDEILDALQVATNCSKPKLGLGDTQIESSTQRKIMMGGAAQSEKLDALQVFTNRRKPKVDLDDTQIETSTQRKIMMGVAAKPKQPVLGDMRRVGLAKKHTNVLPPQNQEGRNTVYVRVIPKDYTVHGIGDMKRTMEAESFRTCAYAWAANPPKIVTFDSSRGLCTGYEGIVSIANAQSTMETFLFTVSPMDMCPGNMTKDLYSLVKQ
ncbi:hypothetical protein QR680_011812 [Steinernema hermaphroditum]|uniref:Uncharacterized protein n=1 Tax=Steinernema hermaphroditum TaxID=289476 RepID=A0AA39I2B6_9BILA|nr:hypothetical protein QR680_011812 [Steinernema hermaphroditum]